MNDSEAGEERERELHDASALEAARALRRSAARASGSSGGDAAAGRRRARRARLHRHAAAPSTTAPPTTPTSGNSHASRSKPCVGGARDDRRAERAISLSSISERVSPGGDPPRDERLHAARDRRARLVERRVAGRADDLSLELALRRVPLARERGRGGERQQRGDAATRRARPGCTARVSLSSTAPRHVRDDATRAVGAERLGDAGESVLRDRACRLCRRRSGR